MSSNTFRKGDIVFGLGRNGATWKRTPMGDVTMVRKGIVRVQWRDCCVEDDMDPADLKHALGSRCRVRINDRHGKLRTYVAHVVKLNVRCDGTWNGISVEWLDGTRSLVTSKDINAVITD